MPVRFLKPGSLVWFHSSRMKPAKVGVVVRVWNQREANLMILDDSLSKLIPMYSIRIVHDGDLLPRWGYCYATFEYPFEPPLLR